MEEYRRQVEADHNEGIPESEWETMEEVIDGFLSEYSTKQCAAAYEIPHRVLLVWLQSRGKLPKPAKMRVRARGLKQSTYKVRIHRGMTPDQAASSPPMDTKTRARVAAYARWDRSRYDRH